MKGSTKLKITGVLGAGILAVGCVLGWYGFRTVMDYMIRKEALLVNGTRAFRIWQEPTKASNIYMQFIMFNITNGDRIRDAGEKPIVQEVGPFSYREERRRQNIEWSADQTELSYNEVIHYYFDKETSGAGLTEDTLITTVNLPLLLLQKRISSSTPASLMLSLLGWDSSAAGAKAFTALPVRQLVFDGVESDELKTIPAEALDLMCSVGDCGSQHDVEQLKRGRFRPVRRNGTESERMTISTGVGGMHNYASVLSYKGSDHLSFWASDYCNMINGTDGNIYPPGRYHDQRIFIFNKNLCRSLYLDYERDIEYYGVRSRRFTPPRILLESPAVNPDNMCFCPSPDRCTRAGALSISSCKSGAPIVASTPHFYNGDEEYLQDVLGLVPDKLRHETYVDIEPMTGAPLSGANRIQVNLELKPFTNLIGLENLPDILLPIMYTNETSTISEMKAEALKRAINTPQFWMNVCHWLLICAGGLLLLVAIVGLLRPSRQQQMVFSVQEKTALEVVR